MISMNMGIHSIDEFQPQFFYKRYISVNCSVYWINQLQKDMKPFSREGKQCEYEANVLTSEQQRGPTKVQKTRPSQTHNKRKHTDRPQMTIFNKSCEHKLYVDTGRQNLASYLVSFLIQLTSEPSISCRVPKLTCRNIRAKWQKSGYVTRLMHKILP